MRIPSIDKTYQNPHPALTERIAKSEKTMNILLVGPTGSGKTVFAEQFAAAHSRPTFKLEGGTISEGEQIVGQWEVKPNIHGGGSTTEFVISPLLQAVQVPNSVIILNELNRFQSLKAENALMSLLDDQRELHVQEIDRTVRVAPNVKIFATINEGSQYTAADMMDYAMRSRFNRTVFLDWLSTDKEKEILIARTGIDTQMANDIVNLAANLRGEAPISLRQMQACAEELQLGATFTEAIILTMSGLVDMDTLVPIATATIPGFKPPKKEKR